MNLCFCNGDPAGHPSSEPVVQPSPNLSDEQRALLDLLSGRAPSVGDDHDPVNAPRHYRSHPSGIECVQITEHMSFLIGNVIKYVWRADEKGGLEDLRKARWYLDREIAKREASS